MKLMVDKGELRLAINRAIDAVEGEWIDEPRSDVISRQAAIDELDEYLEEYAGVDGEGMHSEKWCAMAEAKMVIKELPSAEPEQQWIPCDERLPEAGEYIGNVAKYYLVQDEYGDMMVARYTHSEYWEQIYQLEPVGDKIVAWMPLPKPYKAESEDGYRFYHSTRGGRI